MKPCPIAEVLRRIRPLARQHQIQHLRGLIACEKKHSFRRAELEAALKPIVNDQIRREVRDEKRLRGEAVM
jgi:hypothetical protein